MRKKIRSPQDTAVSSGMPDCCGGPRNSQKPDPPGFDLLRANSKQTNALAEPSCCSAQEKGRFDAVLWISLTLFLAGIAASLLPIAIPAWMEQFSATCVSLARQSVALATQHFSVAREILLPLVHRAAL